jgi:hypothetical protein
MRRLCAVLVATLATTALAVAPAFGGTTDFNDATWDGQGLPLGGCPNGAHWLLSQAFGVTAATLTVDGVQYPMTPSGQDQLSADSTGPVTSATVATAQWVNVPDQDDSDAVLSVSGCVSGGGTGTTGATGTTGTSGTTGTTGTTGGGGGVSPGGTGGTTGGTAPIGGNLPFTGLPVWLPLLAGLGLVGAGYLLLRRKARGAA